MKFGYYADNEIPPQKIEGYKVNGRGYRCAEFSPLPDGGKNVVVLGCSHTFGIGLDDEDVWVSKLENLLHKKKLRLWNLGSPGASPEKCVRILCGAEKVLFPKIIIACWPSITRRQRLDHYPMDLTGDNPLLKTENEYTDRHNLLSCVFRVEKFAEYTNAQVFHCFAEDDNVIHGSNVFNDVTLKNCWPEWDKHGSRKLINRPSVAKDGLHYGPEHHSSFAQKLYNKFGSKLK